VQRTFGFQIDDDKFLFDVDFFSLSVSPLKPELVHRTLRLID